MHIRETPWDDIALGVKTIEVSLYPGEKVGVEDAERIARLAGHVVAKCPGPDLGTIHALEGAGFRFMEMMITFRKNLDEGRESPTQRRSPRGSTFARLTTEEEILSVIDAMGDSMFLTDRISLEPGFGPVVAHRRYRNWILNEVRAGTAELLGIDRKAERVGFLLWRKCASTAHGLLGGIFPSFQGAGLATVPVWVGLQHSKNQDLLAYEARVSSNNPAMVRIYQHFGFQISDLETVLTKR